MILEDMAGYFTEYQEASRIFDLGDYKKANECGKAAYQFSMNYGDLTLDILNTAALAAGLAKDDETYKSMQDYLKTYNYEVSSVVTDCLAGKKTVEQVFITDGGVIS